MPSPSPSARPRPVLEFGLPMRALRPENNDREVWSCVLVDGWVAACRFILQEGRLVIAELRCVPHPPGKGSLRPIRGSVGPVPAGGLTRRWLDRALSISDHLRAADVAVRDAQRTPPGSPAREVQEWLLGSMVDTPLAPRTHPRGRGRPPTDEALFLRVAVEYDDVLRTADRHQVNHVVGARLGIPPPRVRTLVHQARHRCKFLTPTNQGRPGGSLTPLALSRLAANRKGARSKTSVRRRRRS